MSKLTHEQLEHFVDNALRDQPLQRAPGDLENKVMAAITQGAIAPWWRSSFAHWPMAARVLFLIASVGFVKLGLEAAALIGPLDPVARSAALFAELAWIHALFTTIGAVLRSLPSWWIYGGAAVLGALYLMLFGVSAAAEKPVAEPIEDGPFDLGPGHRLATRESPRWLASCCRRMP